MDDNHGVIDAALNADGAWEAAELADLRARALRDPVYVRCGRNRGGVGDELPEGFCLVLLDVALPVFVPKPERFRWHM